MAVMPTNKPNIPHIIAHILLPAKLFYGGWGGGYKFRPLFFYNPFKPLDVTQTLLRLPYMGNILWSAKMRALWSLLAY